MVVIIDYGMGNLRSVEKAALSFGAKVKVTDSPAVIKRAKKIVFPGVGHFASAVKELIKRKVFTLLKKRIKEGVPFLGICLGMQLLLDESEEARNVKGLGIIPGQVRKFKLNNLVVPHMGWNTVKYGKLIPNTENLFKSVKDNSYFYFAHSYYCKPLNNKVVFAATDYGIQFASVLHKDNVWAVQFHPEKSQKLGLRVFDNFLKQ
ncbi:MAG: imidazole glycerol phosphate synthase subunit HisH [Candidatus Omnitrophota bacterium]